MRFENVYNVGTIRNIHNITCFCPLGKDFYSAEVEIMVERPKFIPDYLDTDAYVEELSGGEYIIEDLTDNIAQHFLSETEADHVTVSAYVENAKHSPVEVTVAL